MLAIPVLVLVSATVTLGVILGLEYLRGVRSRPTMIGMHFLLGAASLEVLVMLLAGAPDGTVLLVAALFIGVITPMIGRQSRPTMNIALAAHAIVAASGFVVLVAWLVFGRS
jgi:hypothetical protein